MKKFLILFLPLVIFLIATPLYAESTFAVGLGGGFGDEDVGPGVLSVKYRMDWLETGGQLFYDGDTEDTSDQLGLAWLVYRLDLHHEENNIPWVGAGFGNLFEANSYEDNFGPILEMGWDGKTWGLEAKYGYFDPSLYSFVAYWYFN